MHKKRALFAVLLLFVMGECLFVPTFLWGQTPVRAVREPPLPSDLQLYQKEGHKDAAWDDLVKSGFETDSQGNLATSYVFFKKAYELGCRDALVLLKLGLHYELKQNLKEALPFFVQASTKFEQQYQRHPLRPQADAHAAKLAYELKDYSLSQKFVEQALLLQPGDFSLLFLSGQLQRVAGKLPEARARFEQAMQAPIPANLGFDPQIVILRELIMITAQLEDDDACLKHADDLLKRVPNDKVALKQRERILLKRQKTEEQLKLKEIILGK